MKNTQIVFGLHAVFVLLKKDPARISYLLILENRNDKKMQDILELAKSAKVRIEYCSREVLDRETDHANHQGVVAISGMAQKLTEDDLDMFLENLSEPAFLIIVDGVTDPHNLGAILRSADAAGVHAVIAPKDKAVGITPVVSKVASGAAETVQFIQVTNLARTMDMLKEKNIWIYGAAGEAEKNLFQTSLKGSIALVLGAEGEGLRRLTRDKCDILLKIPMNGTVSSLNVSVAAGIFMFEVVRQRLGR